MPDNGNLTDKLSIEISASVDPAIKAIDSLQTKLNLLSGSLQHFTDAGKYKTALDNMASGFERLSQVVGAIDTGRIASTAKAVGSMGGSFEKVAKSALTFQEALGGFEKTPKTIADVVGEQMTSVLDEFGITAKKDVDLVIGEFTKLGESVSRGVWDEDLEEKFNNAQNALQGVATVARETTETYAGLLEYIRSFPKASVHLPQEVIAEYPDNAWLGKAKTAGGNIFTTGGGTDFSVFLSELNGQLGNIIPMTGNAADEFTALTNAMRIARDEAEELKNGGSRMGISMREAGDVTYQAMTNIQEALKSLDGSEMVEKLVSPFNDMKSALQELSTIKPDFSGLSGLTTFIGKLSGEKSATVSENLARIVESLRGISGDVSIPDFSSLKALGDGISKLGYKTATQGAQNIPIIANALTELSFAQIPSDFTSLAGLAESIRVLGLSSAQKATQNIPQLAQALNDLITSLAEMPEVSDKTLRLVEALGQLDGANMKVANSTNHVSKGHNVASQAIQKFTSRVSSAYNNSNFLAVAYNKVKDGVGNFAQSMDKATSHTQSLTMVIVKARTLLWGFRRIFSMFSGSLELASSLVEVQNVIDNVFTENYADKIEDMSKSVKDSLGMSELSFKQYASRYQAMGKAMGITNSQMISAQDKLKGMGVAYGEANGNMQDMSVNLTRLAADLASFYDIDQKTAFEKLQAVYTGQTRPLNVAA